MPAPTPLNTGHFAKTTIAPTTDPHTKPASMAFPLHLRFPKEGYHKILIFTLHHGFPTLTWSKKVAQWNSKLNGFCYLKRFTRKSQATIADVLGPFPTGQHISCFREYEHNNARDLLTNTTSPCAYHYQ